MLVDLTPFVERLRRDLQDTAAAAGAEVQAAAERLLIALDPAVRMVLLEALAEATAAISAQLDTDTVDVRLNGREPEFVVTSLGAGAGFAAPSGPPTPPTPPLPDDGTQARITLRMPDVLKARAEELAVDLSQSLNTWIVDAIRDGIEGAGHGPATSPPPRRGRTRRVQGWVG